MTEAFTTLLLWLAIADPAPVSLDDLRLFPPRHVVREMYHVTLANRDRYSREPELFSDHEREAWYARKQMTYAIWAAWNDLDDATCPHRTDASRLACLRQLRDRIGWEMYGHGMMLPPFVK